MSQAKVEVVKKFECLLGEGPHWDDNTQTLLFVDIYNYKVHRWNPTTGQLKTIVVKEPSVGCVVPRKKGGLVVAAGHRFSFLDEISGGLETIAEINPDRPLSRFNDGKCDAAGRFLAGTMGLTKSPGKPRRNLGSFFCLEKDLSVVTKFPTLDLSNGLSWTSDNKTMYFCDSLKFCIDAYDYDLATGETSNMREVVKFDYETEGMPDGHTIDTEGNLWVAMFFTGQVIKIDPQTGKKLQYIKISDTALKTTSVSFGGPNLDEIYVTSSRNQTLLKSGHDDYSGSLFKISEHGAKGFPANVFEG